MIHSLVEPNRQSNSANIEKRSITHISFVVTIYGQVKSDYAAGLHHMLGVSVFIF